MTASSVQTVLQRKAQVARRAQEARAITPARALRLALERCAARDLGFSLTVTGVEICTDVADGIAADLPDMALVVLLDGPGGVPGAAVIDRQMVAALVEAQTMRRIAARPAEPRAPTRTDAALSAPLVEGVLSRLAALVEGGAEWGAGVRFGAMVAGGQALALALGTGPYRVMRLGCLLGTERSAELTLALPLPAPDPVPAPDPPAAQPGVLRDRALGAPVRLEAVLARMPVHLARLRALAPGEILTLPAGAFGAARLEGAGGRLVAHAVLGQVGGNRALRLRGLNASAEGSDIGASLRTAISGPPAGSSGSPPDPAWADASSPPLQAAVSEGVPDLSDLGFDFSDGAAGSDNPVPEA